MKIRMKRRGDGKNNLSPNDGAQDSDQNQNGFLTDDITEEKSNQEQEHILTSDDYWNAFAVENNVNQNRHISDEGTLTSYFIPLCGGEDAIPMNHSRRLRPYRIHDRRNSFTSSSIGFPDNEDRASLNKSDNPMDDTDVTDDQNDCENPVIWASIDGFSDTSVVSSIEDTSDYDRDRDNDSDDEDKMEGASDTIFDDGLEEEGGALGVFLTTSVFAAKLLNRIRTHHEETGDEHDQSHDDVEGGVRFDDAATNMTNETRSTADGVYHHHHTGHGHGHHGHHHHGHHGHHQGHGHGHVHGHAHGTEANGAASQPQTIVGNPSPLDQA